MQSIIYNMKICWTDIGHVEESVEGIWRKSNNMSHPSNTLVKIRNDMAT